MQNLPLEQQLELFQLFKYRQNTKGLESKAELMVEVEEMAHQASTSGGPQCLLTPISGVPILSSVL